MGVDGSSKINSSGKAFKVFSSLKQNLNLSSWRARNEKTRDDQ